MINHQRQIIIPAMVAWGVVFISRVISYSLTGDAIDVMNGDNFANALEINI